MLELDRIELASGKSTTQEMKGNLMIRVEANNTIWYGGTAITVEELGQRLKEVYPLHRNLIPQLIQDKKASFGTYQSVKNVIEMAGFRELDVILKSG